MPDSSLILGLIPFLLLAGLVFLLAWRWPFGVLSVFLLLILFHEALLRLLLGPGGLPFQTVSLVSRWRMTALLAMSLAIGIRTFLRWRKDRSTFKLGLPDLLLAIVVLLSVVAAWVSPNRLAGIAAFRNYFQPVLIFYVARMVRPTRAQVERLVSGWLIVGAVMVGFGMYQWMSWEDADYLRNGYVLAEGELDTVHVTGNDGVIRVRPPSSVTGPNEFGLQMILMLLASGLLGVMSKGWRRWALFVLAAAFAVAHMYSFSRSALIGLLAALFFLLLFLLLDRRNPEFRKRLLQPWVLGGVAVVAAFLLGALIWSGMAARVVRTMNRLPQEYHVKDTLQAIEYLAENPLGPGMGLVGPREGAYFPKIKEYHVEGSLFQIAMDTSVVGLALWLAFLGTSLVFVWRAWQRVSDSLIWVLVAVSFTGWIASLVTFLILPLMQSFSLMAWLWFLLGFAFISEELQRHWRDGGDYRPAFHLPHAEPAA